MESCLRTIDHWLAGVEGQNFQLFQLVDGIFLSSREIKMMDLDLDFGVDDAFKGVERFAVNGKMLFGDEGKVVSVGPENNEQDNRVRSTQLTKW